MMDLMAHWTCDRLIDVAVLRNIFGRKALNAIPGVRAAIHEERHVKNTFPLHVTKWIDLDQSPKPLQFKSGQRDGKGPEPQKRDPDRNRGLPLLLATGSEH